MPSPTDIVQALQYLYYTSDGNERLGGSPLSDYDYDLFCKKHAIPGNGGSDRESDYPEPVIRLAEQISKSGGLPE